MGGGPNRIGQGIEFDYCCVHAAWAIKECGYEAIMVNCNPETVSTDYDTSDQLFFEPLTLEDVVNVVERTGAKGVIPQFGGQTPLNLAKPLLKAGVQILGTSAAVSYTHLDVYKRQVEVTTQNHGFAVDTESLTGKPVELTHINLNDHTLEGLRHKKLPMFSVQYLSLIHI